MKMKYTHKLYTYLIMASDKMYMHKKHNYLVYTVGTFEEDDDGTTVRTDYCRYTKAQDRKYCIHLAC